MHQNHRQTRQEPLNLRNQNTTQPLLPTTPNPPRRTPTNPPSTPKPNRFIEPFGEPQNTPFSPLALHASKLALKGYLLSRIEEEKVTQGDYDKYRDGIDLATATPDEIYTYIKVRRHIWIKYGMCDRNLWECFQEDYAQFSKEDFGKVSLAGLRKLRKTLRCGGVYIPNASNSSYTIANTLYEVCHQQTMHKWSEADIEECRSDLAQGSGSLKSVVISADGIRQFKKPKGVAPYNPGPLPIINEIPVPPNP
jgi:hypothetical protein